MPNPPLPSNIAEFLAGPNPAVMATLAKDGRPVTVATWYLLEPDGTVLLNLEGSRVRLEHIRRDPRVALDVLAEDNWYAHVSLQGTVVSIVEDGDLTDIDRLSRHYGGQAYPTRDQPRFSASMRVDRWFAWHVAD